MAPLGAGTQVGEGYLSAMTLNASRATGVGGKGVQSLDSNMTRQRSSSFSRAGFRLALTSEGRKSPAGRTRAEERHGTLDEGCRTQKVVIPAKAGIQLLWNVPKSWIPA